MSWMHIIIVISLWAHIMKRKTGPLVLYFGSIQLCSNTAKSDVKEFIRNNANNCKIYVAVPLVYLKVYELASSNSSFALSWMVIWSTWEKFHTKSMDAPSCRRKVALYQTSFWHLILIAFNVGMSSSREPLSLGPNPAQAICSKLASSKISGVFGAGGTKEETEIPL